MQHTCIEVVCLLLLLFLLLFVQIVQDLNAFKRLLREAESDYHALYRSALPLCQLATSLKLTESLVSSRSYLFLSVCGNGKQLLQCVCQVSSNQCIIY